MSYWVDDRTPERLAEADLLHAMQAVRDAHEWATAELQMVSEEMAEAKTDRLGIRFFNLTEERKRLAEMAWRIKRRIEKPSQSPTGGKWFPGLGG